MAAPFRSRSELFVWLMNFLSEKSGVSPDQIRMSEDVQRDCHLSDEQWAELIEQLALLLSARGYPLAKTNLRSPTTLEQMASEISASMGMPSAKSTAKVERNRQLITIDGQNNAEITVWYGTNRKLNDSNDVSQGFSSERDQAVHYGTCSVFIPASHKIGSLGSSWIRRFVTRHDDRLRLRKLNSLQPDGFWSQIGNYMTSLSNDERHAVIFVHGYNVSFENAALRAAQIGCDLAINGIMAFFSWPSRGSVKGYAADEATIEASEPHLTQFISEMVERTGAFKVHLVAHSMGNRGVLRAINNLVATKGSHKYGQILLAAADVDIGTFRNLSAAYVSSSARTTLYVSARDRAVEASKWLHDFDRAGLTPPVNVFPGIDTVSVTNVDISLLGHGYVGDAREVLTDMHDLIIDNAEPSKRFGLRRLITPASQIYWEIGG
jgi:esterase/lipase superfamily enzyme